MAGISAANALEKADGRSSCWKAAHAAAGGMDQLAWPDTPSIWAA
jgi:hypothetical protein